MIAMQVVYRIIDQVFTVNYLFCFHHIFKVQLNLGSAQQPGEYHFVGGNLCSKVGDEQKDDRNSQDNDPQEKKQIAIDEGRVAEPG